MIASEALKSLVTELDFMLWETDDKLDKLRKRGERNKRRGKKK